MNEVSTFKTRQQLAIELGISYATFWRKIKSAKIDLPKGLICPQKQWEIKVALGFCTPNHLFDNQRYIDERI
jgi:hypothetical protein